MKNAIVILLSLFVLPLLLSAVQIDFYYEPGCKECEKVKHLVIPMLEERFPGQFTLNHYDVGVKENFLKLVAAQERFSVTANEPVSMVVDDRVFLAGYDEIEKNVVNEVEFSLRQPATQSTESPDQPGVLERRASGFTLGAVLLAGLIDGVNPCVFSTLVFFMSILAVSKIGGRRLLAVGLTYCFACYVTNLAIGFGLFRFLMLFSGYQTAQLVIEYLMIAVLIVFVFISFGDAWRYHRLRDPKGVYLKLPGNIKAKIHAVIKRGLKYRYLIPGALGVGALVTVLESACSGQVYVPTLVLLTKETGPGLWFWFLLLYNLMFIIPLLVLFGIAYSGINMPQFQNWNKRNVVISKIALGCLFIMLAALMLWL